MLAGGPHYYQLAADSNVGGEVYERELLRRLPAHNVKLRLGLPADHLVRESPPGWEIDVLAHARGLHWLRAPLSFTPYVASLVRTRRVDVLRGHSVRHTGPALLLGRRLARSHVPVVLHHHHLDPRWAWLEAQIARRADAVITVSEHSRDALVRAGADRARVHVVLEGVERPPPSPGASERWSGGLRLLYVGRLEARKQPGLVIDALARLQGRVDASLVIAGEGPMRPALVTRASGLNDRVRFLGRVSNAEKWALYDAADVLLFPSRLEGFGLVVAEAQSRGVPVVAAGGTATSEAFAPGISGLLADDAEGFADAVLALADDARRAEMSQAARRFAARFDWDRCAAEVAAIYHSLMRGGTLS